MELPLLGVSPGFAISLKRVSLIQQCGRVLRRLVERSVAVLSGLGG